MDQPDLGNTPLDELTYDELLNLTAAKWNAVPPTDQMMDNLIACFGEISTFNDSLLDHPEFAELSGMTGIAELVIDRIINRFEQMVQEQSQ